MMIPSLRAFGAITTIVSATLMWAANAVAADLVIADPLTTDFQLIGATDVDVNGVLYDVTFADGPCTAIFSGCNEASDFDFATDVEAEAAAQALLDQVFLNAPARFLFDTDPLRTRGCDELLSGACGITIPYGDLMTLTTGDIGVAIIVARNAVDEANDEVGPGGAQTPMNDLRDIKFATYAKFTRTTPVDPPMDPIPVPAAFPLFVAGLAGLRLAGRLRRTG